MFEQIETARLILRNISRDDRAFILKQFSDNCVNEFLFDAEPMESLAEADELIDFYSQPEPRGQHRWIILLKATGEKVGTCGFHCLSRDQKCVDIGYDLQKAFWGQGIATEAVQAMLDTYVPKLEVESVIAHIAVGNRRSIQLVEKLGFVFSGETETLHFHGSDHLHNLYVLHTKHM